MPGLASAAKFAPFMSFFTLFSVAVMPLAAALYMVTSTTWSAVERAVLYRWQLAPVAARIPYGVHYVNRVLRTGRRPWTIDQSSDEW